MKHAVTTLNTKKMLAASLKRIMEGKPLSRVRVSEIVADCGVNRKTFYYHFTDVYDLLKWVLAQEAIDVVKGFDLLHNPREAILFAMQYIDANKHILNCAYDSMGRDGMKLFLYADIIGAMRSVIDGVARTEGLEADEGFKDFLAGFYTEALAGMIIGYFKERETQDREELVRRVLLTMRAAIPNALRARAAASPANAAPASPREGDLRILP